MQNQNNFSQRRKDAKGKVGILALFLGLLFSACSYNNEPKIVNVNNDFTITVPAYMKEDAEVKPGAPFQYANRFRNTYSAAWFEEKSKANKSFEDYYKAQIQIIKNVLKNPAVTDSSSVDVGGVNGIHTEMFGQMQGENIYYSHLLLETETRYYQVCVWTRNEERKLKYDKDIQAMLFSFKLLPK
jgi:hypothetical protein